MSWYGQWAPYVPVAQRQRQAERVAKSLVNKGQKLAPINIPGREIANTFWGKAWCDHVEEYCDESNRLPRGRTYARNGSIIDLQITKGQITALVSGSSLYRIKITIKDLDKKQWKTICSDCAKSIHSVIDLMRGKLSQEIITRLTDPVSGLFPKVNEIKLSCDCPDGAYLCKHLAAVLYGVGHRLDSSPELLFVLRGVNQTDLISKSMVNQNLSQTIGLDDAPAIASEDLSDIFGIDLASPAETPKVKKATRKKTQAVVEQVAVKVVKKTTAKNVTVKKKKKKATAKKAVVKKQAPMMDVQITLDPVSPPRGKGRPKKSSKPANPKEFRITF